MIPAGVRLVFFSLQARYSFHVDTHSYFSIQHLTIVYSASYCFPAIEFVAIAILLCFVLVRVSAPYSGDGGMLRCCSGGKGLLPKHRTQMEGQENHPKHEIPGMLNRFKTLLRLII